jgi:hypothetical protein
MRVSGWLPLTSSSQKQWALSLTLTLLLALGSIPRFGLAEA